MCLLAVKPVLNVRNPGRHSPERTSKIGGRTYGRRYPSVERQTGRISCEPNLHPRKAQKHLLDALLEEGVDVKKVFAPEHGFRGTADAGAEIKDSRDVKTGVPIISLYGKNKKPTAEQLAGLDVVVFDIQDVGARFYTYISTMHYVMEACAESGIEFIVLDRPNPNDFVDGPVRQKGFESFVGVDPLPVLHGLTVGEPGLDDQQGRLVEKHARHLQTAYRQNGKLAPRRSVLVAGKALSQPAERPVDPPLSFALFLRRDQYQCWARDLLPVPDTGSTRPQIRRFHLYARLAARLRHETAA